MLTKRNRPQKNLKISDNSASVALPTFLEHLTELRRRAFWVIGLVLLTSAAAFPFQRQIIDAITLPLGGQQLFYLTPTGGIGFIFKICTYVGLLVAIPLVIYHLYRYLEPMIGRQKRKIISYTSMSILLAAAGIAFAYFISLPAALHFLTGFNLENVQAMLTVDSYLSFVTTYLLGAALLFQVPLILLIINSITPLPPKKLMGAMRYVIVGALVIGAIISPTPDVMNQLLISAPIMGTYLVGVALIWFRGRRQPKPASPEHVPATVKVTQANLAVPTLPAKPSPVTYQPVAVEPMAPSRPRLSMPVRSLDGFRASVPTTLARRPVVRSVSQATPPAPAVQNIPRTRVGRSVDGIMTIRNVPFSPAA